MIFSDKIRTYAPSIRFVGKNFSFLLFQTFSLFPLLFKTASLRFLFFAFYTLLLFETALLLQTPSVHFRPTLLFRKNLLLPDSFLFLFYMPAIPTDTRRNNQNDN